ncbi:MAG: L,D-transpeptidase family protein [Parvibaculum sp.]|nr:L,D-transpeptidase family protein [Parvibaculum sp.]
MASSTEILVTAKPGEPHGRLIMDGLEFVCALGHTGLVGDKREGDGGTPIGIFPLRQLRYRPDRLPTPATALPVRPTTREDGWCDAPQDPAYNRPVRLPYPSSAETMWRDDHLYDLVVVLGHNDDPPRPGAGSAIFFHLANEKNGILQPTEGCVALRLPDMLKVLSRCTPQTTMRIERL